LAFSPTAYVVSDTQYLHKLISTQRPRSTRSSSVVTLARPPSSSSLKITDRSFRNASPCLWNQLPLFVNLILVPVPPFPTHLFLHSSLLSLDSPLCSSITLSLRLKSYPIVPLLSPRLPSRIIARTVSSEQLGFCF